MTDPGPAVPAAEVAADATPFDDLAARYDASFTETALGRALRHATWARLDARFAPGERVLEIGCGTGEDAVHLARRGLQVVATDPSAAMLGIAADKAAAAGVSDRVELVRLSPELFSGLSGRSFDGAFSNFGALNCVRDLAGLGRWLGPVLRPGAPVVATVMGPWCPWEWGWYLAHGRPREAFRRLASTPRSWRGLLISYPSPSALARDLGPGFRVVGCAGLGVLLPPSYAGAWLEPWPRLLGVLAGLDRRLGGAPFFRVLGDHYVIELESLSPGGNAARGGGGPGSAPRTGAASVAASGVSRSSPSGSLSAGD